MKLSDTLTKTVIDLESLGIKPGDDVTVYSCGPTVYDHVHIGNLRTFIMDDLLRRSLRADGYAVKAVMNITDVDDKTIAKSHEEHPDQGPMEALAETTSAYEQVFLNDLAAVGVDLSDVRLVRATEEASIAAMQQMISQIHANGFAYIAEGSVYFDVAKYQAAGNTYGRLVNVDFAPQARVDNDEYDKQEARDFVLWKGQKDGEPVWDFALGGHDLPGRPGWHIECSAMSLANLGQPPITIHSGGIDLRFPHHENEIAQTQGALGKEFVDVFTHHNHLFVDGRKMSKSLNNFYTVEDIKAQGFHPLAFRLLCLQAAHTSEMNFTWESLEAAQNSLDNMTETLTRVVNHAYNIPAHEEIIEAAKKSKLRVNDFLSNDLNSADALAEIQGFLNLCNKYRDYSDEDSEAIQKYLMDTLRFSLGVTLQPVIYVDLAKSIRSDSSFELSPDQITMLRSRIKAREDGDFKTSDLIRDEFSKIGYELIDDDDGGVTVKRVRR